MGKPQMVHPEIELVANENGTVKSFLEPVYSTTEKLKARSMGSRSIGRLMQTLLTLVNEKFRALFLKDRHVADPRLLNIQ